MSVRNSLHGQYLQNVSAMIEFGIVVSTRMPSSIEVMKFQPPFAEALSATGTRWSERERDVRKSWSVDEVGEGGFGVPGFVGGGGFVAGGAEAEFGDFAAGLVFDDGSKECDELAQRYVADFKAGGLLAVR